MNLARLSISCRPIVYTAVAMLMAWGAVTFFTISRREDPEFTIRTCVVATAWTGTEATKIEELITDPLEEQLDGIEEVDVLRSTTINGLSTIYVDVEDRVGGDEIQNVWDKVRAEVKLVEMPADGVFPVVNDSFGDTSILIVGIYQGPVGDATEVDPRYRYSMRQLEIYADEVRDALRILPGVADVDRYGVQDEAIYIETDFGTWSQLGLSSGQVQELVASRNIVAAGGDIETDAGTFMVKPGGELDAVAEINSIAVGGVLSGDVGNRVTLADVGMTVRRAYEDPPSSIARFTDEHGTFPAILVGVTMKSGQNIIDVCDRCIARIERMRDVDRSLPPDLFVTPVSNQSDNVSQKIDEVIENVVTAIVIVILVVFVFVGLRTSLVMATSIPLVVLTTIAVLPLFGVELEQISLASIIIALGLLVDNAVQVCDQTRVNLGRGMRADEAACEAATVLTIPMLTGTLTTVAAFFPMLIALQGSSREYIYSLPVTMTATLLISWFLAMTSCVILAAAFIKAPSATGFPAAPVEWPGYLLGMFARRGKPVPEAADGKKTRGPILAAYHRTASVAIKFKFVTVAIACGVLYWTLTLPVSSEFFPQDKKDQFYVTIATPETSTIRETDAKVREIERIVQTLSATKDADGNNVERLRTMRSITGDGGARWTSGVDPNNPEPSLSQILIRTHGAAYTESYIRDLRRIVVEGDAGLGIAPVTGARVTTKRVVMGPPADPLTIRVYGEGFADIGQLRQIADEVKAVVRAQPETWDVRDSWGIDGLQLFVDVDEDQANLAGVTNAEVADTMNSYYSGLRLTTFLEGDHQVPVYFRIAEAERRDLGGLQTLFVEGQNGKLPLNSVATVRPRWEPARIERRDLSRMIEVSSEIFDGYQGNDVASRVMASDEIKEIEARMPPGFRLEIGGSYEESADAGAQMGNSLGTSILLIIMILVIQYNGWSKTLLVLSTLPLALTGAFYGLWVTESVLGFMPQLGLLSLFGIVLNTGIIFIEFADILIAKKAEEATEGPICGLTVDEFRDCLADAGAQRLLPIFLTTATTVGGLLPLALSGGPLWEGMSWLMIFGLLVATVMTLYVLPALYAIFVETFRIKPIEVAPADAS